VGKMNIKLTVVERKTGFLGKETGEKRGKTGECNTIQGEGLK